MAIEVRYERQLVGGEWVNVKVGDFALPDPPIAIAKQTAKEQVSADAETARSRHITLGSGKALDYEKTSAEAIRYVESNGQGEYPFLQARVDSGRYANLAAAAAGISAMDYQKSISLAAITRVEDTAKLAIDAASTVDQVTAAIPQVWP